MRGCGRGIRSGDGGAGVLVVERTSGLCGSSAMSGGELYLGGGTAVQRTCGYTDSAENMCAYLTATLGPNADEEKIRLCCDGGLAHFQWFCDRGVTFNGGLYSWQSWMTPTQDGSMWLGENVWPYDEDRHRGGSGQRGHARRGVHQRHITGLRHVLRPTGRPHPLPPP